MRTKLYNHSTGTLLSAKVTLARPRQESVRVVNQLLDGSYHVQTIGTAARSWEIEFITDGTAIFTIDLLAARATPVRLERYGVAHIGVIGDDPEWEQEIGSTDPARARYRCRITLLEG